MKTVTLDRFTRSTAQSLRDAQHERIVVVRRGKPYALVVGINDLDAEDMAFATSPDFWRMIEESRKRPTVPLEEAEARLLKKGGRLRNAGTQEQERVNSKDA